MITWTLRYFIVLLAVVAFVLAWNFTLLASGCYVMIDQLHHYYIKPVECGILDLLGDLYVV